MCIHFKIHHPYALKSYSVSQIDADHCYFDDAQTRKAVNEFVDYNLIPVNNLLNKKLAQKRVEIKLIVSGVVIELLRKFRADGLESILEIVSNKSVSIIQKPYFNSCSEYFSLKEYKDQVEEHSYLIQETFGKTPGQNFCSANDHCSQNSTSVSNYSFFKSDSHFNELDRLFETSFHEQKAVGSIIKSSISWERGYDRRLLQRLFGLH